MSTNFIFQKTVGGCQVSQIIQECTTLCCQVSNGWDFDRSICFIMFYYATAGQGIRKNDRDLHGSKYSISREKLILQPNTAYLRQF